MGIGLVCLLSGGLLMFSRYCHRITGIERDEPQEEPNGGILADDMGLGKTFVAIALIVVSLERAWSFTHELRTESGLVTALTRTRATLVVVPNSSMSLSSASIRSSC